jgi:hypothetical protein
MWQVWISGDQGALEHLAASMAQADPAVVRDTNGFRLRARKIAPQGGHGACMGLRMDQHKAILDEVCKAAERLGGDRERIRALPRARLYDALEDLGADRYLLSFVGSWGDTMNDGEVLKELRAWNRNGGRFRFDRLIASTGGKRG